MPMKLDENRIASLMKNLQCSREEAIEVIQEDEKIDKMSMKELNAEMTPEQKKAIKDATKTGTRKTTIYKFDTKKTKPKDDEKVEIVQKIYEIVKDFTENCVISNEGREITFKSGSNAEYSLVLTKHRAKK